MARRARGLTRVVAPAGPDRTWSYNTANLPAEDTQPESGATAYGYDAAGLLVPETDARGTTSFGSDGDHRLTSVDAPGTAEDATFTYDGRGNRTRAIGRDGGQPFTFDAVNRLRVRRTTSAARSSRRNGTMTARTTSPR